MPYSVVYPFKFSDLIHTHCAFLSEFSVKWPAKLEVTPPNATISIINETIQFNCTATGCPNVVVQWYKITDVVNQVANVNVTWNSWGSSTNILLVNGLDGGGNYACIGTSITGDVFLGRNVSVYSVPFHSRPFMHSCNDDLCVFSRTASYFVDNTKYSDHWQNFDHQLYC